MKQLLVLVIILGSSFVSLFGGEDVLGNARPPTIKEMQELFDLAIIGPQRIHVIADIKSSEPPWTKEQIAAELKLQNEIMRGDDSQAIVGHDLDLSTIRSNAIARSHSGVKVLHVQEWYSGNHYRLDQTDESAMTEGYLKANTNAYQDTFVNIHDTAFSPYQSFSVHYQLRDVQLSKDPARKYAEYDLWRALGLDEPVAVPLILALVDIHSVKPYQPGVATDLSSLKIDYKKVENIYNGNDPNWRLEAIDEKLDGVPVTRFKLEGKLPDIGKNTNSDSPPTFGPIHATYWVGEKYGRTVCFQDLLTNLTEHSSFFSERKNFDSNGHPRVWKTSTLNNGVLIKGFDVYFKEIDTQANFNDEEIFLPVFFTNNTNNIVSDITSGNAVILQNPHPKAMVVKSSGAGNKTNATFMRVIILAVLLIPPLIMLFMAFRKKLPNRAK